MNLSTWSTGKKLLVMFLVIFFFVGVGVTVYLVQKQQETQSHAQKATVISLSPPTLSAAAGSQASLDVSLNPGTNQVNFVKVKITFDSNVFDGNGVEFVSNSNSPLQMVGDPVINDGDATVTLQVGADPTKVVQQTTTIGTFNLPVKSDAPTGQTEVGIDKGSSQVRSVGGKDAFNENVLQEVANAQVTITGGQCVPNQSTCSWDASDGATSYHYKVSQINSGTDGEATTLITEGDTSDRSVKFNSAPGQTYSCEVTANNECGTSDSASGQSTCPAPSLTPVPSLSPTPGPSSTPTPGPSSTPTPTTPETVTPTTPETTFVTATPIPTNEIAQGPTITPAPTLPATGNPVVTGGIIGGILFVLGGLALLFL